MSARTKTKSVLDAEVKRLRSLLGVVQGQVVTLSSTNFVWDPLAARSGNVYPAWDGADGLGAAIAAVQGQKTVTVVNPTLCHIPAGAWPGITDVTFIAGKGTPLEPEITIDDGATFTFPADEGMRLTLDGLTFINASTSPVVSAAASDIVVLVMRNDAQLVQTGGAFLSMAGTSTLVGFLTTSSLGAGVIAVEDTPTLDIDLFDGSTIAANAIQGATGAVALTLDAASLQGVSRGFASGGVSTTVEVLDPPSQLAIDPLGAAGNGVYTTWDALAFARSLIDDPIDIWMYDDVHVPAGAWPLGQDTTFAGFFVTLTFDEGASISPSNITVRFRQCTVVNNSTVSPFAGITTGMSMYVEDFATVTSAAGKAALVHDTAAGLTVIIGRNGTVGDGVTAVVKSDTAPGTAIHLLELGTLRDDALATAAGGSYVISRSPGATLNMPLVQNGSTVGAYLFLNIVNLQQATGNGGTGTHTVTETTPTLVIKKSGQAFVTGSCAGSTAAADAITATLVRDIGGTNTTIATRTVTTTAGQLNYNVDFSAIDTIPAAGATYSIRLAGAQNNTVAANQCNCIAIEQ